MDGGVYSFVDQRTVPDPVLCLNEEDVQGASIVIDNGSYMCRMGWSTFPDMSGGGSCKSLTYKNILAKTRREKGKESELLVANDIANIEAMRFNLKTPFDRNVVTQFETQETLLDYGFVHLGLNGGDTSVQYPIVMTEPLAAPNASRSLMNELLFEAYNVPRVAYGVDGLFSAFYNAESAPTKLIVSVGFHTVSFIPVVEGAVAARGVRRINLGGFQLTNYLWRSLQLKYPTHVNNITVGRAEEILHRHCQVAKDYQEELNQWKSQEYYAQNVKKMQLPFTVAAKPAPVDPEVLKQRRQELAKRLVEMNAKKREERMMEDKSHLRMLQSALTLLEQGYDDKVKRMLTRADFPPLKTAEDIQSLIDKTKGKIEKAKMALERRVHPSEAAAAEVPPEKKRREDMSEAERAEFDGWIEDVKQKRQELMDKRAARHHRKQQLAKRRTAASQERMRMISQLAKHSKKDDNFGMNDADWDVYKKINKVEFSMNFFL